MTKEPVLPHAVLLRPRIYIGDSIAIGPGKIDLLRAVGASRSISAAARSLDVPYKRAWLLIDSLNKSLASTVMDTATGGRGGGGASLTELGKKLIAAYDTLEQRLNAEAAAELKALCELAGTPSR
ncbi:winged helix-turn-helix domain-containing protein [Massilia putida]|uniref:winged helix-turn-helix domain-containing protein n=1 Tax=Massilia putida TaxID=1141883 RepID=UPI00095309B3|nr:LysR family transcriptional regulator [Massilia putida]